MLRFDTADPYPLLSLEPGAGPTYAEEKEHAAQVDAWLGLEVERIEGQLVAERQSLRSPSRSIGVDGRDQQDWIGLPPQSLLTPYTELRTLLHRLSPQANETIVDLGAGYGRMGFVLAEHYPDVNFIGYELVAARVEEGNLRLSERGHKRAKLVECDLSTASFIPQEAEYYFLYDYGTREAIEKTLRDLRGIASRRPIQVVGRGRASRDAIELAHPWLSGVVTPEHYANYSIYRSR
jgi:hypothetical protein